MRNFERYKSSEERYKEFIECLKGNEGMLEAVDLAFSWLDLEAEDEKPLPCPFCGDETKFYKGEIGGYVKCRCGYSTDNEPNMDAIAAHNRVARAVMAAKEKEAK